MSKFKIGDILIGKRAGDYSITTNKQPVRLLNVYSTGNINVEVIAGDHAGEVYTVDAEKFKLYGRKSNLRDLKKKVAPRFVKAVVVEERDGLPAGNIVVLDLATVKGADFGTTKRGFTVFNEHEAALVNIVGSKIDYYTSRFAIDPTLRVEKKELINA